MVIYEPIAVCTGKAAMPTRALAVTAARRIRDRTGDNLQPYHCTICHHWHVGSPANKAKRERPQRWRFRAEEAEA